MSVYDVAALGERFDIVLFLGVLYHLRHPLLALDLIREHAVRDLFVCQSMQRGDPGEASFAEDYPFSDTAVFEHPGFPRLSLYRAPLRRRRHQLVGSEPLLHRGDAAQRRICRRSQSGGGSVSVPPTKPPTAFGAVYPALPRSAKRKDMAA